MSEYKVLYLCDGRACKNGCRPGCRHTTKIEHAKNFVSKGDDYEYGLMVEQEPKSFLKRLFSRR